MRTPLTYYGGKQLLARQIVPLFPPHRVYLEAFAGGAACLFAKPRAERETLNDLDGSIMRFWRVLRDRPEALAGAVMATPYSREGWGEAGEPTDDDLEAARRLLVRVDQSFSRSRQSWSVPCIGDGRGRWQPGTWANLPPKILAAAERLSGVALEHRDALDLIPRWDRPDALIYLDPPYTGEHRTEPAKGYAVERVGLWADLVETLRRVNHAAVILSGYPCDEASALGWAGVSLRRMRTVQARDRSRLPTAPEMLWSNRPLFHGRLFAEGPPMTYSPEIERDEQGRAAQLVSAQSIDGGGPSSVTALPDWHTGKKCLHCGALHKPHQGNQLFCSRRCYDQSYNTAHPVARQRSLPLAPPTQPVIPTRDRRVPKARRRFYSDQARRIMDRLELGPVTNAELARMFPPATAWRSRLSDCRWELRRRFGLRDDEDPIPGYDCGGGLVWHWIEEAP